MGEERRNRIFLIGNGFDLSCDLKTKYEHFIENLVESWIQEWINNNYGALEKENLFKIELAEEMFGPFINWIDKYAEGKENSLLKKIFDTLDVKLKEHYKNTAQEFFVGRAKNLLYLETDAQVKIRINIEISDFLNELYHHKTIENWVDIEQLYFDLLCKYQENKKYIEALNRDFEVIKKYLENYLHQHYQEKFANKLEDKKLKILKEKYTNLFNPPILKSYSYNFDYFINFNYTNTLEDLLDIHKNDIVYIHGKLKDAKQAIIFGYGDEMHKKYPELEEQNNNNLLKYMKSVGYSLTVNYQRLTQTILNSGNFDLYILGHSCGLSDRILLNMIFTHEKCKKIFICYHNHQENFENKVINISRHFHPDQKQKMRDKIIDFEIIEKYFKIPQYTEEETEKIDSFE